jgi:tetratricopeptide (TPR) repeat protein
MNNSEWDAAVESYKKAIEVDPEFVQCVFNAGVCLNSKAIALNDQLADKKTGGLTKDNAEKVKSVLRDAQGFLERARELDGDQLKVKWAYPLYRIYYSLQMKDKMAELEAIDPSLAQ